MAKKNFSFELITQDKNARVGKIKTPRGEIDTPVFMPVGTQGTVKGIFTDDLLKSNSQIILGNTYHLLLRPGLKVLEKFRGLHKFMQENADHPTAEYYIPDIVTAKIQSKEIAFSVIPTNDNWFGVTYKEDKQMAIDTLNMHIKNGVYPMRLWS